MKKIVTVCVLILTSGVLNAQHKEFSWLKGSWKIANKNMFETWEVAADGKTLNGSSYKISASDTTMLERTKIAFKGNSLFYIADVAGNNAPVEFAITWFNDVSFVAENPRHDFPKLIRYKLVDSNGKQFIHAAIEGDGKVIPYIFEKVR
jgi:hypothetical protein